MRCTRASGATSDHPRACGANYGSNSTFQSFSGSSPRMRGKRSPSCLAASRPDSPDHPRACGANSFTPAFNWPSTGSSPRMRGKLICRFCRRCRMRIIPAHAGQTTRTTSCPARYPDHPRACGANLGKIGSLFGSFGSSPRMRGKRRPRPCPRTPVRIIPAHAGQTSGSRWGLDGNADHPRACGANKGAGGNLNGRYGSSPRMRGKPHQRVMPPAGRRIIPAHAGQTRALARPDQRRTDHPRACGANSSGAFSMIRLIGSSPRMRGKRVGSVPVGILARIIPAHAGQTQSHQRNGKEDADHPRACGANNGNN